MNIKTDVKQQERLDKFFAEENTWFPGNVGEIFLAIFFFIISGILLGIHKRIPDIMKKNISGNILFHNIWNSFMYS